MFTFHEIVSVVELFYNAYLPDDFWCFRVVVTGVLADRSPADLHLFRNYVSGEEMLGNRSGGVFNTTKPPHEQCVWRAARASGAAPSYFRLVLRVEEKNIFFHEREVA